MILGRSREGMPLLISPAMAFVVPFPVSIFSNKDGEAPKELAEHFETTDWELVICPK